MEHVVPAPAVEYRAVQRETLPERLRSFNFEHSMIVGRRANRRAILLMMLAILLAVVLVIDWSLALTGVTAAVIGEIFRLVLQVGR